MCGHLQGPGWKVLILLCPEKEVARPGPVVWWLRGAIWGAVSGASTGRGSVGFRDPMHCGDSVFLLSPSVQGWGAEETVLESTLDCLRTVRGGHLQCN